ncbi:uncharacterized protein LOC112501204 [Cynara cardunculus var. scolymus]|uniref:C2 calcium-dependent membrane targeting n=1 Tax=Cynara cardunculus var. scolymus TaxID=59895 RepID=A0A124SF40_CYNCS|nr:uncharacterized protein LOC112501204 [Cynara cardunculus var. scolymus]KVI02086.1 C2 calcium-dependent membrane targeting [Cynara cardunculus var. scolymus]
MGSRQNVILPNKEGFIGVLEVFIHQARDIHNICIYHKQDVYGKIFLTSDPEATESTRTINGGGQNPVFNENLRINVRNGDCSLRCEIWMLSRVRNYLEDQLLGFSMVPLCEILAENGKLEKEFELSTSELFHSPSGFVKLSITYIGSEPDVMEIPVAHRCVCDQDSEECDRDSRELEKLEFPDPKVMNENEIMVSEYYSNKYGTTETDDSLSSDSNNHIVSGVPEENLETTSLPNVEIPSRNNPEPSEKKEERTQSVVDSLAQPGIGFKSESEQKVVQQEIVDMYLKSMKQFTEALAKMKLPMDTRSDSPDIGGKNGTESNGKESNGEGPNPKVFYGSRAFF